MARGTQLKPKCPFCQKDIDEVSRTEWRDSYLIESRCGHTIVRSKLETEEVWPLSRDGRQLFPFQKEGVKFLESADCNGLLLDEQGLGKTVQECMLLNRNKESLCPALLVVKSGLRAQWFTEVFRWTGMLAQVIEGSREKPDFDIADVIIVSLDSLRLLRPDIKVLSEWDKEVLRKAGKKVPNTDPVWTDEMCAKFKHICVDESHLIKNAGSSRTQALRKIAAAANDGKGARIICMSGTNIEKHAGEQYVTLNLVRPELFHNEALYRRQYCEVDRVSGKIGGLLDPAAFRDLTSDFIIRRLRKDVLPDLPKIFRQFRLAEIAGRELDNYKKLVKEFMKFMDSDIPKMPNDILGFLTRMRHITGIAKADACVDFLEEFLEESGESTYEVIEDGIVKEITAPRKVVVFLHHQIAGEVVLQQMHNIARFGTRSPAPNAPVVNTWAPPMYLNAEVPPMERQKFVDQFKKPENRIMLASTMAAAEGINMQFVSDAVMMERQWNPSKEEQAEGRFPRPGSRASQINVTYIIAAGTIDDFLTTLVERKRRNVAQTLDGKEMDWDEKSLLTELADVLRSKGLAKWGF